MSGGKETPRQKMIGMMYLVLTALLALNVSSTVLEKFAIMNTTLEELIGENIVVNEAKLVKIEKNKGEMQVVKDAVANARKIRELSKSTLGTLDSIKQELSKEHDGTPISGPELVGNTNLAEEKMLNETSTLAPTYERKLIEFVDKLQQYSGRKFNKLDKKAEDFPELAEKDSEGNIVKNEDGTPKVEHGELDFIEFSFHGNPTMSAIAGISQMQTEILEYETLALDRMDSLAGATKFDFDVVVPVVIGPTLVASGAQYEGKLFMAATTSGGPAPEMFRDGVKLNVSTDPETGIKMADVKFSAKADGGFDANGNGKGHYTALIKVEGKPEIKRVMDYKVVLPTVEVVSGARPSAYLNCGNPITFNCPVLGEAYNPNFSSAENVTIIKGDRPGVTTLIPKQKGKIRVNVTNAGTLIATKEFDVLPIPNPHYVVKDDQGREIGKDGVAAPGGLRVSAEAETNFKAALKDDSKYRIKTMEVYCKKGNGDRRFTINPTTEIIDLSAYKSQFQRGDLIVIDIRTVSRKTFTGDDEKVEFVESKFIPIK
jgi:gliding motility-associated protein GldM